jgi:hypothetical protein
MPPYISTRAYIQWLPDPPSEPTSTQVLTSSQRHFVDIRVATEDLPKSVDPAHVEWAFAGHSASKVIDGKTFSQWHHWIDSSSTTPEDVIDKGEMLPEDAEGLALEKGAMVNPATGRVTEYVEGWQDVEIRAVTPPGGEIIKSFCEQLHDRGVGVDGLRTVSNAGSGKLSLVLQHENVERRARGMVVRLGQICQGVMRVGDEFAYERWEWTSETGWCKTRFSSDLDMPCDVLTILGELMCTDTTVTYGHADNQTWNCVEAEQF